MDLITSTPKMGKPNYITTRSEEEDAKNWRKLMHKMMRVDREAIENKWDLPNPSQCPRFLPSTKIVFNLHPWSLNKAKRAALSILHNVLCT